MRRSLTTETTTTATTTTRINAITMTMSVQIQIAGQTPQRPSPPPSAEQQRERDQKTAATVTTIALTPPTKTTTTNCKYDNCNKSHTSSQQQQQQQESQQQQQQQYRIDSDGDSVVRSRSGAVSGSCCSRHGGKNKSNKCRRAASVIGAFDVTATTAEAAVTAASTVAAIATSAAYHTSAFRCMATNILVRQRHDDNNVSLQQPTQLYEPQQQQQLRLPRSCECGALVTIRIISILPTANRSNGSSGNATAVKICSKQRARQQLQQEQHRKQRQQQERQQKNRSNGIAVQLYWLLSWWQWLWWYCKQLLSTQQQLQKQNEQHKTHLNNCKQKLMPKVKKPKTGTQQQHEQKQQQQQYRQQHSEHLYKQQKSCQREHHNSRQMLAAAGQQQQRLAMRTPVGCNQTLIATLLHMLIIVQQLTAVAYLLYGSVNIVSVVGGHIEQQQQFAVDVQQQQYQQQNLTQKQQLLLAATASTQSRYFQEQIVIANNNNNDQLNNNNDNSNDNRNNNNSSNKNNTSQLMQGLKMALSIYSSSNSNVAPWQTANDPTTSKATISLTANMRDVSATAQWQNFRNDSQLVSVISRDNMLKNLNENNSNNNSSNLNEGSSAAAAEAAAVASALASATSYSSNNDKSNEIPIRSGGSSSCTSCQQLREKAKLENLESIKMHILRRLQLTQLPNITAPITVPHNIIENFYKNYNASMLATSGGGATAGALPRSAAMPINAKETLAWRARANSDNKQQQQQQFAHIHEPQSVGGAAEDALADDTTSNIDGIETFSYDLNEDDDANNKMMQSDQPHYHHHQQHMQHPHHMQPPNTQQQFDAGDGVRKSDVGGTTNVPAGEVATFKPATPILQSNGLYTQQQQQKQQQHDGYYATDNHHDDDDDIAGDRVDGAGGGIFDYEMDDYYSRVNSVYLFPTMSHFRHNRKLEILNFKYDINHSMISRVILHLYIHGRDWLKEQNNNNHNNNNNYNNIKEIVISIHRAIRHPNTMNYTHTIKLMETQQAVPNGLGQWLQIEMPALAQHWMLALNNKNNDGNGSNSGDDATSLGLVIRGQEAWMRPLIVTGSSNNGAHNKQMAAHIEVVTEQKRRRKRSTSLDCQESDHEVRCCRYPLKVNFTTFGWHFVVAPTSFDAYFCNGECKVGYLEHYTHTHLASLTTSASPCCSPTKMSPLSLLYFNEMQNLVLSTIPNMSVEKCSCS